MKRTSRFLSVLLTLCMILGMFPGAALAAKENGSFSDVGSSTWYSEAVEYVYEKGLMSGTGDGSFSPDATMSRAMLVTILYGMESKPAVKGGTFYDVDKDQWYADAVAWASTNGIVSGYGGGLFGPNDIITREQMAAILYSYAKFKGYDVSAGDKIDLTGYSDYDKLASWAVAGMKWACGVGLISGVGGNELGPQSGATRAQAAVIFRSMDINVVAVEKAKAEKEKDKKPSGGGGGGITGGTSKVQLTGVKILLGDADMTGQSVKAGDTLSFYTIPADTTCTVQWKVGGTAVSTASTYTVKALDAGSTITVTATGTGNYTGTVTSAATGAVVVPITPYATSPDTTPVHFEDVEKVVFKDEEGNLVDVSNAELQFEVTTETNATVEDTTTTGMATALSSDLNIAVNANDLEESITYVAVDADLFVTSDNGDATQVHPVGDTVVTLTKANLGIAADEDIADYTFVANHTNKDGVEESVTGTVVTVNGEQCVRFVLNGLSRIYIGNVPPLTVTFDTDGGTAIDSQKVKLGGFAKYVEPPVKEGWLFAGWDHDLKTENIIKNITVTALWVKGTPVTQNQISVEYFEGLAPDSIELDGVEESFSNGTLTLTLDDTQVYAANLLAGVAIAPVDGAEKAMIGETAQGAMDELDWYENASDVAVFAYLTDDTGAPKVSNETYYIKWVGANDKVLGLQSLRLVVKTQNSSIVGDYDTETKVETVDVNRGLGQVEFWLTNGTDSKGNAIEDYVGAINGYLNGYGEGYRLNLNGNFTQGFSIGDNVTAVGERVSMDNYSNMKIVITPFEGETFSNAATVKSAKCYAAGGTSQDVNVTCVLSNGNLVLTCAKPNANTMSVQITLELNGVEQRLNIYMADHGYNQENWTHDTADSWDGVAAKLAEGYNSVTYTGSDDLDISLTLEPMQDLYIPNGNLNIVDGGVLNLKGNEDYAGGVYVNQGALIVKDGGKLTVGAQDPTKQYSFTLSNVLAYAGVSVENGGSILVPEDGYLDINNGDGGFNLAQGGQVTVNGRLHIGRNDTSTVENVFAGRVDCMRDVSMYAALEVNDGLTIASTGAVYVSNKASLDVYGGLTVEAGGKVVSEMGEIMLSGASDNAGTMEINGGALTMWNTGYTVTNSGEIYISEDSLLNICGTVLVNSGKLTGAGNLDAGYYDDTSSYDNGIEWVIADTSANYGPSYHNRNQFVKDPAKTVEVTYFQGKLENVNSGSSTLVPLN